jgi:hypothetical protein
MQSEFRTRVEEWIPVREETIEKIKNTIDTLKVHHRNVNISRITGSGVSIAGSLIAIAGFGLAFVTLGASIGLTVPGIALAVAGGSTAAGASIADTIIQKSNVKKAQEQLKDDYDQLYTIQVIAKIIDNDTAAATDARKECPEVGKKGVVGEVLAHGVLRAGNIGVRAAEIAVSNSLEIGAAALRIGGAAARSVAVVGLVLNVALIPIDLIEIVRSSLSLKKGSQTKAVKQLKGIGEQLQQQLSKLKPTIYENAQDHTRDSERDQAGTGSGTGPETGPGTESNTEPGMEPDTEPGSEPDTRPETELSTGTGTGPDTRPGTDPVTEPGTEPGTELGTGTGVGSGTSHK